MKEHMSYRIRIECGNKKRCPECEELLPDSDFYVDKSVASGLSSYCKKCCSKQYRKHHPNAKRYTGWYVQVGSDQKYCPKCETVKPETHFHKDGRRGDGLGGICGSCARTKSRVRARENLLWSCYKITLQDYADMFEQQNGVCAICGFPESVMQKGKRQNLAVDHCHKTGKVRGLLCHQCNKGIGNLKDDLDLLASATSYLINAGRSGI